MKEILNKEDILGAQDRKYETVMVPEWGGKVRLQSLSGKEREEWENYVFQVTSDRSNLKMGELRARLIALCAVDSKGNRLFGPDDVPALAQKSATALERVFQVAQRLSGLTEADLASAEKN